MTEQVKSKQRVTDHGEVFTSEREVNAMLDLVKQETERVDIRFLEPACGDGNFLAEVLSRKMAVVKRQYKRNHLEFEKYSVLDISSIYGVELLEDNAQECRNRIYEIWNKEYTSVCKKDANDLAREAVRYIIQHNILCGDALTMLRSDGEPIIFSQWDLVSGNKMKRRDYRFDQMMKDTQDQLSCDSVPIGMEYDSEIDAWVPVPIMEYPLTNYWEVQDAIEF